MALAPPGIEPHACLLHAGYVHLAAAFGAHIHLGSIIDYTTDSNQLLFVTSENVREGYISLEKEKYLPLGFNEVQKRSVLQKGDVLFNIVGASIGRAAIFELGKLSNINQAVALIRLDEEVLNQYVNYFLNSE